MSEKRMEDRVKELSVLTAIGFLALSGCGASRPESYRQQSKSEEGTMQDSTGSDAVTGATLRAVERFNEAFNRHDVDAVMAAMTDDCVFENTSPFPDGTRHKGQVAVRKYWETFFRNSPTARFESEEIFAAGDRCVVLWVYRKIKDEKPWHLRGVDVFRVRGGKVCEKFSYVKG